MPNFAEKINKKINEKELNRQLELFFQSGVPLTPEHTAPMNNNIARSSIFAPIKRGKRKFHDNISLSTQEGSKIYYTGKQLDMADQDVLLQAMRLAAGKKPDVAIEINRSRFLEAIGMSPSGPNYRWLKSAFERLYLAYVKIENNHHSVYYRLLDKLRIDKHTGEYYFSIPKETMAFFINNAFGYVNMENRLKLAHKVDLAKWLQTFATSHSKEPYAIYLEKLKEICGYSSPLRKFREAVKEALKELERVGELSYAEVTDNDLVRWQRC